MARSISLLDSLELMQAGNVRRRCNSGSGSIKIGTRSYSDRTKWFLNRRHPASRHRIARNLLRPQLKRKSITKLQFIYLRITHCLQHIPPAEADDPATLDRSG